MVFRLFRQNKKATRWIYIVVTLFTMFTFSVTGAVYAFFDKRDASTDAGSFVTPGGKKIAVSAEEFRFEMTRLARSSDSNVEEEQVWESLMLDALADEAGIVVSDEMLSKQINQMLSNFPADQRAAFYDEMIRRSRMSAAEWEASAKRSIRAAMYRGLFEEDVRVRSEEIFKRFQDDNESFTVDCVLFRDADFTAAIDRAAITEAELQNFFDKDLDFQTKNKDFSTAAELTLDVAVLEIASADVEKMRAALPEEQRTVQATEIQRLYDERKEAKYVVPPADGATTSEKTYKPLDEVKAELEKEILVKRVISAANAEVANLQSAARMNRREQSPAPVGIAAADTAAAEDLAAQNHLLDVAAKYGLEFVPASGPQKWQDLAAWERFGSAEVKQNLEYASEGSTYPFHPRADAPRGYVVSVVKKVEPKPLPFAEIKDKLVEPYVAAQAAKKSAEAANGFVDALRAAVRPKQQTKIDEIEKAARERAAAKATEQNVTDEAAKAKLVEDELKAVEPDIKRLLDELKHEAFDDVVKTSGRATETVGPFRESYRMTRFFQLEPKSLAKSVMQQFAVTFLEVGKVSDALRDEDNKQSYVVRVKERTKPSYEDMGLGDRARAERSVRQLKSALHNAEQQGRFDFAKLSLLLNLQRPEEKTSGE